MDVEYAEVGITIGFRDVTGDVIWRETNFQVSAGAQPGSCQIALRTMYDIVPGKEIITLYVNGRRMWQGYPFVIEQGYIFPDSPQPKMTIHGVDLNILFDKLVMYNRAHPTKYPDGAGTYKAQRVTLDDGKTTGLIIAVPPDTSDKSYIQTMLKDFDLDKVDPLIKWGQTTPSDCRIEEVGKINYGDTGSTWTPPSAGTSLRAFFQDVSANVLRGLPGSSIWYIDPDGYIVYRSQDYERPDFTVGDDPGSVAVRDLTVTTDISRLKNDVLVFTGTLDPRPSSTQEFLLYVHNSLTASINQYGRFQWSEVMGSDWEPGMIRARSNKLLFQEGVPAMQAEFTVFRSGLWPGQLLSIFSGVHTFTTFDPTFGLQTKDYVTIPIRAIGMTFPQPNMVSYRVTCSFDTQDPWGLLLALKRPAARGLVQPNFNVINRSTLGVDYPYITASPMILVKEWPERLTGNLWQCTYAYIRYSMTVVVDGLRKTTLPDPDNGLQGFKETNPDKGIFYAEVPIGSRPYVEYHVWHELDANTVAG